MSLVTPALAKKLINTSIADADLQTIIDRVEAQITEKIGAPQTNEFATQLVRTVRGEGENLYMPTEIYSVVSIVEDGVTLETDEYQTWAGGVIERLPVGSLWGDRCTVTYKPADDRSKRSQVIIDMVRLVIERTAMQHESVAGEYSYDAPDNWDAEFNRAMKRLTFKAV